MKDLAAMRGEIQKVPKYDTLWSNLYEWSVAFSQFAFATLRVVLVQNEIDALQKEVDDLKILQSRAEKVQQVMGEENVVAYFDEAIQSLTERVAKFEEIVKTDEEQA